MCCPRGESDNPDGSWFCIEWGILLRPRYPGCRVDTLPQVKCCGECDTPPTGQIPAPHLAPLQPPLNDTDGHLVEEILLSKTALEGERKQMTVLFADLKGYVELPADRDSEKAHQWLDPVLEGVMAALHRFNGTINQDTSGGVMILFGAPIAHEDNPQRKVRIAVMNRSWRSVTWCGVRSPEIDNHQSVSGNICPEADYRMQGVWYRLQDQHIGLAPGLFPAPIV